MKTANCSTWLAIVVVAISLPSLGAKDIPGSKDHPLLKRFEGSEIVRYKAANYDTLDFYDKDNNKLAFEGKLVRVMFRVPAGKASSSLEVYRNYESELKDNGWRLVNSGPFTVPTDPYRLIGQRNLDPIVDYSSTRNPYYIYAVKHDEGGDVHCGIVITEISRDVGPFKAEEIAASVDSIQVKPVTKKMTEAPPEPPKPAAPAATPAPAPPPAAAAPRAAEMAKSIASSGRVQIYGIYFDFNKTDIKPESKPTLDEIAKLLNNDATLKLVVIGHTDNVGTPDYNNSLSLRRAQSVVKELTTTYRVAGERLVASGAGFTKPIAPNDTEEGRAKNRRVELVKM
jgi:outer membrane protein OmpA-like peptidoglycan-associated protein